MSHPHLGTCTEKYILYHLKVHAQKLKKKKSQKSNDHIKRLPDTELRRQDASKRKEKKAKQIRHVQQICIL